MNILHTFLSALIFFKYTKINLCLISMTAVKYPYMSAVVMLLRVVNDRSKLSLIQLK